MIFLKTVSVYLKSYHTRQKLSIFLASCAHLPAPIKNRAWKFSRLQQKSARCSLQRFAHAARVGDGFRDFVIFFRVRIKGQRRQRRNIDRALSSENALVNADVADRADEDVAFLVVAFERAVKSVGKLVDERRASQLRFRRMKTSARKFICNIVALVMPT